MTCSCWTLLVPLKQKLNGSNFMDWSKTVRTYLRSIRIDDHFTKDSKVRFQLMTLDKLEYGMMLDYFCRSKISFIAR